MKVREALKQQAAADAARAAKNALQYWRNEGLDDEGASAGLGMVTLPASAVAALLDRWNAAEYHGTDKPERWAEKSAAVAKLVVELLESGWIERGCRKDDAMAEQLLRALRNEINGDPDFREFLDGRKS